ncbi:MAG: hydroxymethylglutaryl-CoA lyase [Taibaiella sp.]|nr:hydroxymethylglutaryl-CoA lyase [Taibaiella sp.]
MILTECPRDAMQGWGKHIPTSDKAAYLNQLLKVGFDVLDFGSFVSSKSIPQLADTKDVIPLLDMSATRTKLLAIIANTRGAEEAVQFDEISYLGFPLSVSETFQMRNTNKTIEQSLVQVAEIQRLCVQHQKELVVYISMGFGNPYGDVYNADVAIKKVGTLSQLGVKTIAMSDTIGVAKPDNITYIFNSLIPEFRDIQIGAHFHSTPDTWKEKMDAAYSAGCRRYDSALKGIGGCPMAEDELVGNMATEHIIDWCDTLNIPLQINRAAFDVAYNMAAGVFIK